MKQRSYCAYFQGEAGMNGQRNITAEVGTKWVWVTVKGRSKRRKMSRKDWDQKIAPTARLVEEV